MGAILAMRNAILAQPAGKTWLVATGTLTNVALLCSAFPEIVYHIKGLSIMGGAIGGGFTQAILGRVKGEGERLERFGNCTPWAEFNIYVSELIVENCRSLWLAAQVDLNTVRP